MCSECITIAATWHGATICAGVWCVVAGCDVLCSVAEYDAMWYPF